ncbi:serine/threonine-protein kinase [Roseimaritima ulvae]|uniref:non-specific serine/threonine protein kinase n=1 Tax=Roseimaritima ulvae TaxID=980254 RepID=A0A5B9R7J4_9BACT|nr:serine/threonine-protein kinase [Roseimaritima ulvae]QEG42671.1 Serine/threonine-protein kinase PknB [Roseimaritima ulvae]
MIAKPRPTPESPCSRGQLQRLLDDCLPPEQAALAEAHLAGCEHCRDALHELAGSELWWTETRSMLRDSTLAVAGEPLLPSQPADASLDASLRWIQPLLQPSESTHELGLLGNYPIVEIIGQGGMGVVLRGVDRELNRPVAIKVLAPHLAGVGAARQRFMREAQAAAAIVHPHVIPIYGIETEAALPYLVMPFVAGGNLQQRIDTDGAMELEDVLRVGVQIAEGLAAAHRQGVIHRDVKPANMLVEAGNGRVLISDFGLARALDDATLTVSGMIAGTPQFMSPEQASGDAVDARSDLFSLGSLLFALATGRPPFRAESPLAVLRKICDAPPRPVHEINERMPPWFSRLVQALMQVDVLQRIASAEEAAELMRAALQHVRQPGQMPLPQRLRGGESSGRVRIGRRVAAAATILATVVSVAVWQYRPGTHNALSVPPPPGTAQAASESVLDSSPSEATTPRSDPPGADAGFDASWEAERWQQTMRALEATLDSLSTPEYFDERN